MNHDEIVESTKKHEFTMKVVSELERRLAFEIDLRNKRMFDFVQSVCGSALTHANRAGSDDRCADYQLRYPIVEWEKQIEFGIECAIDEVEPAFRLGRIIGSNDV